jgi:hypothetical protein
VAPQARQASSLPPAKFVASDSWKIFSICTPLQPSQSGDENIFQGTESFSVITLRLELHRTGHGTSRWPASPQQVRHGGLIRAIEGLVKKHEEIYESNEVVSTCVSKESTLLLQPSTCVPSLHWDCSRSQSFRELWGSMSHFLTHMDDILVLCILARTTLQTTCQPSSRRSSDVVTEEISSFRRTRLSTSIRV